MDKMIPGYSLLTLEVEEIESVIYKAVRLHDQQEVAVKTLKAKYPSSSDLLRVQHEYDILKALEDVPQVVKAIALEESGNNLTIILESFSGVTLKKYLEKGGLALEEFLEIAQQIAEAIGFIHHHHIIHKDLRPETLLYDQSRNKIKIIEFGFASNQLKESPNFLRKHAAEGSLTYISPEQTGRMSRKVDYRTDLYSLGVIFYEMLVGLPPLKSNDPMELMHFHIAKTPTSPHELIPSIPSAVSAIVMKCLSKIPEDRYYSAFGLKNDLEECFKQYKATKSIKGFVPGERDVYDRFQISPHLYGREKAVLLLLHAFDRITYGKSELMLISGYAGVGKTSLVQEVQQPIKKQQAFFISGKCDQLKREIPYGAWLQSFENLIRQLLTKSPAEVGDFKDKILDALQENSQVLIDLVPDLELLIGKQKTPPILPTKESQNRLRFLFNRFIKLFATKDHALVIFLDDLQWADPASLQLLKSLMVDVNLRHVLIIGAYRDLEVDPSHPLMITLDEIQKEKGIVNDLKLQPLALKCVKQLVADTLHCSLERAYPLARQLFDKTQGNPFFLIQYLKNIYKEKELTFDLEHNQWRWDIERIQHRQVSENVIDFMIHRIQQFSIGTQAILFIAAVIGVRVEIQLLAQIAHLSFSATLRALWPAVKDEMIKPIDTAYHLFESKAFEENKEFEQRMVVFEFIHERVQQASYSLLPEVDKAKIHREIGQYLYEHTLASEKEENLFEITAHFNKSLQYISNEKERHQLARLNLAACHKAKKSAAYLTAFECINVARHLLSEDSWEKEYDFTYSIFFESAECAYLVKQFELIDGLSKIILKKAKSNVEKGRLYILKIDFHTNLSQTKNALESGFECLKLFGMNLKRHSKLYKLLYHYHWFLVRFKQRNFQISELENRPLIQDKELNFVMEVFIHMLPPAFLSDKKLFCYLVMRLMRKTLRYGNSQASFVYLSYAAFLEIALRDYKNAHDFCMLALKLCDKQDNPSAKCIVNFATATMVNHWSNSLKTSEPYMIQCQTYGIESGELTYTSFMGAFFGYLDGYFHQNLQEAYRRLQNFESLVYSCQNKQALMVYTFRKQVLKKLVQKDFDGSSLSDESFDEKTFVGEIRKEIELAPSYQSYAAYKSYVCYLFRLFKEALLVIEDSLPDREKCYTLVTERELNVYHSLTLTALYREASRFKRWKYRRQLKKNQKNLKLWALTCPTNNAHRYAMVQAEIARIKGEYEEALTLYDEAIRLAKEHEFTCEEALCNELAARLLMHMDKPVTAKAYLLEAHYGYYRWGAEAKVHQLEQEFSELLTTSSEPIEVHHLAQKTAPFFEIESDEDELDLKAAMHASSVLTGEIRLEKLLTQLMNLIIENAGADRAVFLLEKNETWLIQAEKSLEQEQATVLTTIPLNKERDEISTAIVHYVMRTKEDVVLNDAVHLGMFTQDTYILRKKPKSILCMPLIHQGKLAAIIYLENRVNTDAFTQRRRRLLGLLSTHITSATLNSLLYSDLERASEHLKLLNSRLETYNKDLEIKVTARTQELQEKNQELKEALFSLTEMQKQVVQHEKLAALGALTQGVAHEIKNPLNFINNFSSLSIELLEDLKIALKNDPNEVFLLIDYLKQNIHKIHAHGLKADGIVMSMLKHSNASSGQKEPLILSKLLKEYMVLGQQTTQQKYPTASIEFESDFDSTVSTVTIVSQDIGRCLLNIIDNASYSLNEKKKIFGTTFQPKIVVTTKKIDTYIEIRIGDNGLGIPKSQLDKVFTPFFTTKPTGTGTGLGLSITYDIIVKEHEGTILCKTEEGEYCEFIIQLPIKP